MFHAMQGIMVADAREKRLMELHGRLMRDVVFGWRLLGRLHKDGTFAVRQEEVAAEHWEVTFIDVHITGKALFFKTISEQQGEERSAFQQVPGSMTLGKAVELLEGKCYR